MNWKQETNIEDKVNLWQASARKLGISNAMLSTIGVVAKGL